MACNALQDMHYSVSCCADKCCSGACDAYSEHVICNHEGECSDLCAFQESEVCEEKLKVFWMLVKTKVN